MTYLMRLTDKKPDQAIASALQFAIQKAQERWPSLRYTGEWGTSGLVVTNLRARDISVTNQATGLQGAEVLGSTAFAITAVTVSAVTTWINLAIDDRIFLVVTGFFSLSPDPHITEMRFSANGETLYGFSTEEVYTWQEGKAYLSKPLVISPANNFTVDVRTDATITKERIGLLGYIVAQRTYAITFA